MNFHSRQIISIVSFSPEISPAWRQKLLSFGLLPGSVFEIVRIAPLGDPIEIRTCRQSLMLRKKDMIHLELREVTS
ncbi:ferrous iron transporter A [Erwinia sp. OLTSP20]|uniref:ferrous iron transporter A n=1 Tax=unclassified Erwinia TaxID=2622719 RepID=UPI000C1910B8|nr:MULTISPECIES: ferrous iron transporter A [unclassified Erwinia]PIJ49531.1 ferrous iron transporter A [Erwinia sp. OAMSP11]PIJ71197.1 ferrous iron transporter A [Erwinia sp. OLSSP12]PIJ79846.1 ferrous iron transporter A [Erwinia sp. OLCASP19]PIJ81609.1 ferrous iron transporter A [Erwinia sp. OLMTSP26]PIJ84024.1 ferrous iron transporter A [Erwinia sp. OLMDSP33]